jgi:uncharacterized membrane protein YdjX (TVP38/TMEM64 family)
MLWSDPLSNNDKTVRSSGKPGPADRSASHSSILRLVLVMVFIASLITIGKITGASQYLTTENVKNIVQDAGIWGYLLFIVIFTIGEMLHIFGLIFVAAGVYAFGLVKGLVLGLLGGIVAVSASFLVMRAVGGRAFASLEWPWVKRMLKGLDRNPIRTVFILRLFLIMHPSLNYLLALTRIRFRDYFIGSAVGLIIPISLFVIFFEWLIQFLT